MIRNILVIRSGVLLYDYDFNLKNSFNSDMILISGPKIKGWRNLIHPRYRAEYFTSARNLLSKRKVHSNAFRININDGGLRHVYVEKEVKKD